MWGRRYLYPMYKEGNDVKGIDLNTIKIEIANEMLGRETSSSNSYEFLDINFFEMNDFSTYDLIFVHDVIEHIIDKELFFLKVGNLLKKDGLVFFGFPAWQMPFGGHQQICKSKLLSIMPFIHLLPKKAYRGLLNLFKEETGAINELLEIKECKVTVESFEKLSKKFGYKIIDRTLWLINPHYKTKFGLPPAKLPTVFSQIPYVRNYLTTSCFFILTKE